MQRKAEQERTKRIEKRRYSAQHRGKPERDVLIQKLNKMPVKNKLILISRDDQYAPNFYPTRCAGAANMCIIKSLPKDTRRILALKLKGKHRGPWGEFKKRLLLVVGPISNRKPWGYIVS